MAPIVPGTNEPGCQNSMCSQASRTMRFEPEDILSVLDRCCDQFTFPILDNGYVYLAGTRLSLYRSAVDWAIVIEVFGFSPGAGLPDTCIYSFASRLHNRQRPDQYVSRAAYEMYLAGNPHNEFRSTSPIDEGPWQDAEDLESVAEDATEVVVGNQAIPLPRVEEMPATVSNSSSTPRTGV